MRLGDISLLAVLLFHIPLYAEPMTDKHLTPLDFAYCEQKMNENHPSLKRSLHLIEASDWKRQQAKTAFLPVCSVSAGLVHLDEEPPQVDFSKLIGPNPVAPQISGNPLIQYASQDNWSAGIRIMAPVYTGGRNSAQLVLSGIEQQMNRISLQQLTGQLYSDLTRTYYGVTVHRLSLELTAGTIGLIQKKITLLSNFVKSGATTDLELMKSRVLLAQWETKQAGIRKSLEANITRLSTLTGIPKNGIILTNRDITAAPQESENFTNVLARALANRPEIRISDLMEKLSEQTVKIKTSQILPQANVSWNSYWSSKSDQPGFTSSEWNSWWDLRVSTSWEFFNLQKWMEREQSGSEMKSRKEDNHLTREKVRMEVEEIFWALEEAKKSLEAAEKNLQWTKLNAENARQKKLNGSITETEELEHLVAETESEVQHLRAKYDFAVVSTEYARITGKRP